MVKVEWLAAGVLLILSSVRLVIGQISRRRICAFVKPMGIKDPAAISSQISSADTQTEPYIDIMGFFRCTKNNICIFLNQVFVYTMLFDSLLKPANPLRLERINTTCPEPTSILFVLYH
jgi:hypothetical protein